MLGLSLRAVRNSKELVRKTNPNSTWSSAERPREFVNKSETSPNERTVTVTVSLCWYVVVIARRGDGDLMHRFLRPSRPYDLIDGLMSHEPLKKKEQVGKN